MEALRDLPSGKRLYIIIWKIPACFKWVNQRTKWAMLNRYELNGGFHGGTQNGWFSSWKIPLKWMMPRGTPMTQETTKWRFADGKFDEVNLEVLM